MSHPEPEMTAAWTRPHRSAWIAMLAWMLCLSASPASAAPGNPRLLATGNPYLLQHAQDRVQWYPWGEEALTRARTEDKPIFLSVGFLSCYWCQVAKHELYADPQLAAQMNRDFVNVLVDREQRPDIDALYMLARQVMTAQGGWPNNVLLTPDLKPFYAGSYLPRVGQGSEPGFAALMQRYAEEWKTDRSTLLAIAARTHGLLERAAAAKAPTAPVTPKRWRGAALDALYKRFDDFDGGFGSAASKFPRAPRLEWLLAEAQQGNRQARGMLVTTLRAMAEGGLMDQLAGGFHRYSADPGWDVPHYEKMLYDNAQLLAVYSGAAALTQDAYLDQVARRTARFLSQRLRSKGGSYYTALDSAVNGVEGASYLWTRAQIETVLGADSARDWFALYALSLPSHDAGEPASAPGGVLRIDRGAGEQLAERNRLALAVDARAGARNQLLKARDRRPQPQRDDKRLVADNALAILALTRAARDLKDDSLRADALAAGRWLYARAFVAGSTLPAHAVYAGKPQGEAFAEDVALLGLACLALAEAEPAGPWQTRARKLADSLRDEFLQADGTLIRSRDALMSVQPPLVGDMDRPSAESTAIALWLRLAQLAGSTAEQKAGDAGAARLALQRIAPLVAARPQEWGSLLATLADAQTAETLAKASPLKMSARSTSVQIALPAVVAASAVTDSASVVSAEARRAERVLVVTLAIQPGWHVNAHPASHKDLIPTTLLLGGAPLASARYPAAQRLQGPFATALDPQGIAVYTGTALIQAPWTDALATIPLKLRVQACNDNTCLPPTEIPLSLANP